MDIKSSKIGLLIVKIRLSRQGPAILTKSIDLKLVFLKQKFPNANTSIDRFSHWFLRSKLTGIRACNGFVTISFAPSWKMMRLFVFWESVKAISICKF